MAFGDFDELVTLAKNNRASDIHVSVGQAPCFRIDGSIVAVGEQRYGIKEMEGVLAKVVTDDRSMEILRSTGELDLPYSLAGVGRLRVNIYRQRGSYALAARLLNPTIPNPRDLSIPESVVRCCDKKRGMILFTGPTGSGKSTSLASLIDHVNRKYNYHIITLEDPSICIIIRSPSFIRERSEVIL